MGLRVLLASFLIFGACAETSAPEAGAPKTEEPDTTGFENAGRYLVFNRWVGNHKHLFRANADGSGIQQLTSGQHDNVYPEISGDRIYFSSGGRDGITAVHIFTMDLDGQNVTLIPIALPNAHMLMPSACGDLLFFVAVVPGVHDHLEIYRVDIAGGVPTRLTTTTNGHPDYIWSSQPGCNPTRDRLVYSSTESGSTQIWTMDLDGTNPQQLTFRSQRSPGDMCQNYAGETVPCYDDCNAPFWGKHDEMVMFCGIEQNHGEVFTMRPDGSEQRQRTNDPGILSNDDPSFSLDGQFIIFTHGDPGTLTTTLQRVDLTSNERVTVLDAIGSEFTSTWGGL